MFLSRRTRTKVIQLSSSLFRVCAPVSSGAGSDSELGAFCRSLGQSLACCGGPRTNTSRSMRLRQIAQWQPRRLLHAIEYHIGVHARDAPVRQEYVIEN